MAGPTGAPDRDTLRLTAAGGPTPAQLAGARRELLRRPEVTLADVRSGLGSAQRAVVRTRELYASLAGVPDGVLLAAAQPRAATSCGWCLVRLDARVHGRPMPPFTATAVALLGSPCANCRPPRPKPARRRPAGSTSTRTRASTSRTRAITASGRNSRRRQQAPVGPAWVGVPDTPESRAAAKRLNLSDAACGWA